MEANAERKGFRHAGSVGRFWEAIKARISTRKIHPNLRRKLRRGHHQKSPVQSRANAPRKQAVSRFYNPLQTFQYIQWKILKCLGWVSEQVYSVMCITRRSTIRCRACDWHQCIDGCQDSSPWFRSGKLLCPVPLASICHGLLRNTCGSEGIRATLCGLLRPCCMLCVYIDLHLTA